MNGNETIGSVVVSKKGRDAGGIFLVVGTQGENFVLIADGELRKIQSPKLKKIKHLEFTGERLEGIAEKLNGNKQVFDPELKNALKKYNGKSEVKSV